jgi:hypothetical protein
VYHNTFFDNDMLLVANESSGTLENNIVFGGEVRANRGVAWEADRNVWTHMSAEVPYGFLGNNDLWLSDPRLGPNLYPFVDSPVIDSGTDLGLNDDYCGRLRMDGRPDVGAHEYLGETLMLSPCENVYEVPFPAAPNVSR